MSIWGSLVGGFIGFSFAGPIGALIGSIIGGKISSAQRSGFRKRFAPSVENQQYVVFLVVKEDEVLGGSIHRSTFRDGIQLGVLMDIVFKKGAFHTGTRLLKTVHNHMFDDGCDAALFLDNGDHAIHKLVKDMFYLRSPENYNLIFYPNKNIDKELASISIHDWPFAFSNHDAF